MHARTILATPKLDVSTPRPIARTTANATHTDVIKRADAPRTLFNAMTIMPAHMIIAIALLDV